jgi:hypothetical protein
VSDVAFQVLGGIICALITGGASIYVTRSARPVVYVPVPHPLAAAPPPGQLSAVPVQLVTPPTEAEVPASSEIPTSAPLPQAPAISNDAVVDVPNQAVIVKKRSAAFVIGLVGLIAWFLPIVGIPLAAYGLYLASKHRKTPQLYTHLDPAVWLNVMALTAALVNAVLGVALAA